MDNEVIVSVRTELQKILDQLGQITKKNQEVAGSFKEHATGVDDAIKTETKSVSNMFDQLRGLSRRVFDQMKQDFKSLASIKALESGLKISNQFEGTVKEVFNLSDAVRRLGNSFGIAKGDFAKFQGSLSKGFGDIGASSDEAAAALQGLTGTGLKGQGNVTEYAKTAAQLGMLSGERGQAGNIAGGLAGVVRAQGKDVNDVDAMRSIAREVTAVSKTTGKGASEVLRQMQDIFESMPDDLRKSMSPKAIGQIGLASVVGGPGAGAALKQFLGMGKEQRAGLEAQGFGKIFGKNGELNIKGLQDVAKELKGRGVSSRMAAETLGLQGEAAEGMVRLIEKSDELAKAMDESAGASQDYAKEARHSMGFGESFKANIRKVQGALGEHVGKITQGLTDVLSDASESTAGAAAVTLGGGALAAVLAGGGLKGIGQGLGIQGMIKKQAIEGITGEKVQDVRVINFEEAKGLGGGGLMEKAGGMLGGTAGTLLKGGAGALSAGMAGYQIGSMINESLVEKTQGTTSEGFQGNVVEQLFFKLDKLLGGQGAKNIVNSQNIKVGVVVETKNPELKASPKKPRGSSN